MTKSKAPWHICDDCLIKIADGLQKLIRERMRRPGADDVVPNELDSLLSQNHFEFGLTWLKICVSVDFAKELQDAVTKPIKRYSRLHRYACCRLQTATGTRDYIQHVAITKVIELEWQIDEKKHGNVEFDDYRPVSETENRYGAIEAQLEKAIAFIRHTVPILRAMIERRGVKLREIPTGKPNEQPATIAAGNRTVAMNAADAGCIVRGLDPRKTKKKQRNAARAAFVRNLPSIPHECEGKMYVLDMSKLPARSIKYLQGN